LIYLENDAGTGWLADSASNNGSSFLYNSQCAINNGDITVSLTGTSLTLNVPISFSVGYGGAKTVYMMAVDAGGPTTGWLFRGSWTVPSNVIVSADSVSPNSGAGGDQKFALQYYDSSGTANLQSVWVWFNATFATTAANSCLLYYQPAANQVALLNDAGTEWAVGTAGNGPETLSNSQCSLNLGGVYVNPGGTTLTLNLSLSLQPSFSGAKNIYMYVSDLNGLNSGWQQRGTWTVPAGASAAAVSVTPSSGSGTSQSFAFQYSDTNGTGSLAWVWAWFSASLGNTANSCLMYYQPSANQVNLLNDAGTAWTAATPGAASTLQNSQCSLNMAATTVALNGNTLTLNLATTFLSDFGGIQNVYMFAADMSGSNTGWLQRGTWTVPGTGGTPAAVSVTPSSGVGVSHSFALQYSDTAGAGNLAWVWAWFNTTLGSGANSCLLYYQPSTNQLNLLNDAGTAWTAATPDVAGTLQNSQCSLNMAATSVVLNGNTLKLNLAVTFKSVFFSGTKNVYMYSGDVSGSNTGWLQLGTWTLPDGSGVSVMPVSVVPGSGSGSSQSFTLQYSDVYGPGNLAWVWAWFSASLGNTTSSCLLYYQPSTNQVNLLNDAGTAWTAATPGEAGTLQNSQCSLNLAATSVVPNGYTLTLGLAMTFHPSYAGAKNIYMYAADGSGANSGWQQMGTWTVPSGSGVSAAVVSVTPSSGSGTSQSFALLYSDTNGTGSLAWVWVWFNASLGNTANSCLLYYQFSTNQVNLLNDTGTAWTAATPGAVSMLQNSQCSLNLATTTVTPTGNTLTLNLAMTFQSAYARNRNIYMYAGDVSGSSTGWLQRGAWMVP
jgi:hypothetical protein